MTFNEEVKETRCTLEVYGCPFILEGSSGGGRILGELVIDTLDALGIDVSEMTLKKLDYLFAITATPGKVVVRRK